MGFNLGGAAAGGGLGFLAGGPVGAAIGAGLGGLSGDGSSQSQEVKNRTPEEIQDMIKKGQSLGDANFDKYFTNNADIQKVRQSQEAQVNKFANFEDIAKGKAAKQVMSMKAASPYGMTANQQEQVYRNQVNDTSGFAEQQYQNSLATRNSMLTNMANAGASYAQNSAAMMVGATAPAPVAPPMPNQSTLSKLLGGLV